MIVHRDARRDVVGTDVPARFAVTVQVIVIVFANAGSSETKSTACTRTPSTISTNRTSTRRAAKQSNLPRIPAGGSHTSNATGSRRAAYTPVHDRHVATTRAASLGERLDGASDEEYSSEMTTLCITTVVDVRFVTGPSDSVTAATLGHLIERIREAVESHSTRVISGIDVSFCDGGVVGGEAPTTVAVDVGAE